ncbi:MAG: hypothetical protein IJW24_00565 [Clostridia bacterium]|nr:hypothetical protein [Clostridia bacterium]
MKKWHTKKLVYGFKHKLVFPYPDGLFDRLRPFALGGLPASILLFENELCNGHCYDRARLISLALKDATVVHADIDSLRVQDGVENPEHAFVETTDFGGGKTWVIDTSIGLVFDKDYYYKIERPKVNHVFPKDFLMKDPTIHEIIASNFENDKYMLTSYLPFVEAAIKNSRHLGTVMYRKKILEELEVFKKAIGFDELRAEIDADIKLMFKDPAALDAKFGIVRDQYGREMSRNGVPNPYYKSREEMEQENAYLESIKDDPDKLNEFWSKVIEETTEEMQREYLATEKLANQRLELILKNPTANFYELFGESSSDVDEKI